MWILHYATLNEVLCHLEICSHLQFLPLGINDLTLMHLLLARDIAE